MNVPEYFDSMPTPLGELVLTCDGSALTRVFFVGQRHSAMGSTWIRDPLRLASARRALERYFSGEAVDFDLPLAPRGTPFQLAVWRELARIPRGCTLTYGRLAALLGKPAAARAVGAANGKNPISIIVPCHRVVGTDGSLTGYAGGNDRKSWLLSLEGARPTNVTWA